MNLPPGTAVQGGGMASAQFERVTRVGDGLVGLSNDHAIDAHTARQNPLLGAAPWGVGMPPQQPIQQGAGVRFAHSNNLWQQPWPAARSECGGRSGGGPGSEVLDLLVQIAHGMQEFRQLLNFRSATTSGSSPGPQLGPNAEAAQPEDRAVSCSTCFSRSRMRCRSSGKCCIAIIWRLACLSGAAGMPRARPPSGMSRITPDFAPIMAWLPTFKWYAMPDWDAT